MASSLGLLILIALVFFCALIGATVWLYSAQSAKRQKAAEPVAAAEKGRKRNGD